MPRETECRPHTFAKGNPRSAATPNLSVGWSRNRNIPQAIFERPVVELLLRLRPTSPEDQFEFGIARTDKSRTVQATGSTFHAATAEPSHPVDAGRPVLRLPARLKP